MAATSPSPLSSLVFLNGPEPGRAVSLDPGAAGVTIGRDDTRDVPLDDPVASRLHARCWFDGQHWQLEDCGSSNGTKVNSEWVERAVLEPGDLIRIGDSLIVYLHQRADTLASAALRPSVLAGTTSAVKISASDRDAYWSSGADESDRWPAHLLPLVFRLSTLVTRQPNVHRLAKLVAEAVQSATQAAYVVVWLTGRSGRLRRVARVQQGEPPSGRDHVLASLVMERDEAVLTSTEPGAEDVVLAAPVPGSSRPRGAIECYQPQANRPFQRADLEFLSAVAHQLGMAVDILQHRQQLEQANAHLRRRLHAAQNWVGDSPSMNHLSEQVHRVAPTESNVLVLGESGTGKELVAHSIHELSRRSAGPFVAVNCAAFNESLLESELFGHEEGAFTGASSRHLGQFERAHSGTIFLDEVGELSPTCQAKLLRLLEGHPFSRLGGTDPIRVDTRVVAATHRNLIELCRQGTFREDLYFRLRVIELQLPPLRERGEDILRLAVRFLDEFRRDVGRGPSRFSAAAADALMNYPWPGNVRELKNAVERAVVLGRREEVGVRDLALGAEPKREGARLTTLAEAERQHIAEVLRACEGNKTQACRILGIGRGTLYTKLRDMSEDQDTQSDSP